MRTCGRICVEDMIKWLMLFYISSPLIWAPSLGAQTGMPALASEGLWILHCIVNSEREPTKINTCGATAKVRILLEQVILCMCMYVFICHRSSKCNYTYTS